MSSFYFPLFLLTCARLDILVTIGSYSFLAKKNPSGGDRGLDAAGGGLSGAREGDHGANRPGAGADPGLGWQGHALDEDAHGRVCEEPEALPGARQWLVVVQKIAK